MGERTRKKRETTIDNMAWNAEKNNRLRAMSENCWYLLLCCDAPDSNEDLDNARKTFDVPGPILMVNSALHGAIQKQY